MLSQKYSVGILLFAATLMAMPVHAQWKSQPAGYAGSSFDRQTEMPQADEVTLDALPAPYAQLQTLLGNRLYGYLLQNDEFIVLQDLVITHLEKQYPVLFSAR